MMYILALIFLASFAGTFILTPWIIPKLKRAGLVGSDVNKEDKREVAEMGGFTIIFGFSFGLLLSIALYTFLGYFGEDFNLSLVLAGLSTILLMTIIGIFDDLFSMRQFVKATLPLFAALPLVAVKAGETTMIIPFIGSIDFGIFYTLILIPIGVAGASNVTNMLAGFNGLEAGMGAVACLALAVIASSKGNPESLIILVSMLGALVAFLYFNRYPAKIFIGDIGTLSIGAVFASSVIIGNFESAGLIIILPYTLDFFIKAVNRFPSERWWGEAREGKLYCPGQPVGLCQTIMKAFGGIKETYLVYLLIGLEAIAGVIAILMFMTK